MRMISYLIKRRFVRNLIEGRISHMSLPPPTWEVRHRGYTHVFYRAVDASKFTAMLPHGEEIWTRRGGTKGRWHRAQRK
jgi:hypothetical protein